MTANVLHTFAPAKLNLVLRIVGRRADGYHLLETLFQAIDLGDDVWVEGTDGGLELEVESDGGRSALPAGTVTDNLVGRALAAVQSAAAQAGIAMPGFRAHLRKRVPVGGGLGGGSSDAAAALRLANALLPTALEPATLHGLAAGLGADVAFFLAGGAAWGTGVGDVLTPVEAPAREFVLVVPPFDCETAAVYKNFAAHWNDGPPQGTCGDASLPTTRDCVWRIEFSNDLTAAAEAVRPELATLRRRASELAGVPVVVTGSGSTLFLTFDAAADATQAQNALAPLLAEGVQLIRTRAVADLPPITSAARLGAVPRR